MQALQIKNSIGQMFNIQEKENGEIAVSGRELHKALEVKTPCKKWFERMSEYGFEENVDYSTVGQNCPIANGGFQFVTDQQ